ncbi:Cysteine-rich protein [Spironucleus salmonicida]|uniref:Cysteine-rich protein n=2 Tax=Spironucleus TaxID=39709 RepID=V6LMC9_9EUKA|nr:5'-nucleotidase [Spironucleus barkhanus]KAH0576102.1 Cysteine-rich protein [Spironucleus salmonicida]|eukprot:EST45373.1 Cysteine-rich protein [Spironucleus salmonicida]
MVIKFRLNSVVRSSANLEEGKSNAEITCFLIYVIVKVPTRTVRLIASRLAKSAKQRTARPVQWTQKCVQRAEIISVLTVGDARYAAITSQSAWINCVTWGGNADKYKNFVGNFGPKEAPACIEYLDGFFRSETRGKRICAACSKKCIQCTSVEVGKACYGANCKVCSVDNNSCGTCKTGYKLFGGKCELECNTGDIVCTVNQICLDTCKTCQENCTSCQDTVTNCKSCVPDFALDGSSCAACSAGCTDCAGDKNVCNLCKDGYFGINGACQSCEMNTTAQCECSGAANCATCTIAKSGTCGTCIAGYKMSASNTCFTAFKCTSDVYMSYLVTLIHTLQRLIANTANFAIYQTLGILVFVSCFL